MRKDPEKKQAGKERRKKRLAAIISICLSIAVVITAIAGTIAYTMTNQLPQDEKQFSEKERRRRAHLFFYSLGTSRSR